MSKSLNIFLLAQLVLVAAFLWFSWLAGQAMDKSGIGDYEKWESFSGFSSIAFYCFVLMWLSAVFISAFYKSFGTMAAQRCIVFPPLFLIFSWFLLVFF